MATPNPQTLALQNLASAFLTSEWTAKSLRQYARKATGESIHWMAALVRRVLKEFPTKPDFDRLFDFVDSDRIVRCYSSSFPIRTFFGIPRVMTPPPAAAGSVELPQLTTEGSLADWLGVPVGKLLWYADTAGRNRQHPNGPLRPYRYRWVGKPGGRSRLLEIPKAMLKKMQRQILVEILGRFPVHAAAHGFCSGRSIVTNAGPHCGKRIVVRFDLTDFFPSVSAARVYRTFDAPDKSRGMAILAM